MRPSHRSLHLWIVAAALMAVGWGCRGILGAEYGELVEPTHDGGVGGTAGTAGTAGDSATGEDGNTQKPPLTCYFESTPQSALDLSTEGPTADKVWNSDMQLHAVDQENILVALSRISKNSAGYDIGKIPLDGSPQWASFPGGVDAFSAIGRIGPDASGIFVTSSIGTKMVKLRTIPDTIQSLSGLLGVAAVDVFPIPADITSLDTMRVGVNPSGSIALAFDAQRGDSQASAYAAVYSGSPTTAVVASSSTKMNDIRVRTPFILQNSAYVAVGGETVPLHLIGYDLNNPTLVTSDVVLPGDAGLAWLGGRPASDTELNVAIGDTTASPAAILLGSTTLAELAVHDPRTTLNKVSGVGLDGFYAREFRWCDDVLLSAGVIQPQGKDVALLWIDKDGQKRNGAVLSDAGISGKVISADVGCAGTLNATGGRIHVVWIEERLDNQAKPFDVLKHAKVKCF